MLVITKRVGTTAHAAPTIARTANLTQHPARAVPVDLLHTRRRMSVPRSLHTTQATKAGGRATTACEKRRIRGGARTVKLSQQGRPVCVLVVTRRRRSNRLKDTTAKALTRVLCVVAPRPLSHAQEGTAIAPRALAPSTPGSLLHSEGTTVKNPRSVLPARPR